jgi:glycosyltransferase involved in cell wall biosynthesis
MGYDESPLGAGRMPAIPSLEEGVEPMLKLVVIVPALNEAHQAERILSEVGELGGALAGQGVVPLLVVVDDGSRDGTAGAFRSLGKDRNIPLRLIRLARNFGKDAAMLAGLEKAEGDYYVLVDADGQTPFRLIPEMLKKLAEDGVRIVYAVKDKEPYGFVRKLFTHAFYWLSRRIGIRELQRGLSDFMLFTRHVRDRLLLLQEKDIVVRNMIRWIGEPGSIIGFTPAKSGQSRWSIRQLAWLAVRSILSFSNVLRINFYIAIFYWVFSLVYALIIVIEKLTGHIAVGLSTTTLLTLFSFGLLFFMIAIIGEYLIALFDEVKKRPRYLIESLEDVVSGRATGPDA